MKIPDVNVLVAAFRLEHAAHDVARAWLRSALESDETLGLSSPVASGVVRLLTQRRLWPTPDTPESALLHLETLRLNPGSSMWLPGPGIGSSSRSSAGRPMRAATW